MENTIQSYFTVPVEKRDASWKNKFFKDLLEVPLIKGDVFLGPDGFPYTAATLMSGDSSQIGQKISEFLDELTIQGTGLVIFDEQKTQLYVFSYGSLCSVKQYGTFVRAYEISGTNKNIVTNGTSSLTHTHGLMESRMIQEPRQVLMGQPNEFHFPAYARKVVKEYLLKQGIHDLKLFLMEDPTLQPSQALVFSIFIEDFPNPESYYTFMERLAWFFPPPASIIAVRKHQAEQYQQFFQPL